MVTQCENVKRILVYPAGIIAGQAHKRGQNPATHRRGRGAPGSGQARAAGRKARRPAARTPGKPGEVGGARPGAGR